MESGFQSFEKNFKQCCGASAARLAYERQQTEAEYSAALKEYKELFQAVDEKLGDSKLLIKFDTAKNRLSCFDDIYLYQQGFQDCVYLLRWIGLL